MHTRVLLGWAVVSVLAACGGGGGGGGGGGTGTPQAPFVAATLVANAGNDLKEAVPSSSTPVTLDGSNSIVRDDQGALSTPSAFSWTQTGGPAQLVISNATSSMASVTLTSSTAAGTYVFQLEVTEGSETDTDEVSLVVKPFIILQASDELGVGFSHPIRGVVSTTIPTSLAGSPSGTVTFAWSGIPATFVNVVGTNSSTLTFESPLLTDLEALSTRPGPLGLWAQAGAIQRLTLTATDGITTDSIHVNVSFGVSTTGLRNVPVDSPCYLNGGESVTGTWSWMFLSFAGSSAPNLFGVDDAPVTAGVPVMDQVVFFTPDTEGAYEILVQRETANGPTFAVIRIEAASHVSNGVFGRIAPDPNEGHCAGCHGGSVAFLNDNTTPWQQTLHARVATIAIDPDTGVTGDLVTDLADIAADLQYVTTGFYVPGDNNGFDDVAGSGGQSVPFHDLDFASFETRYPESAAFAQVQCESCHGPGSLHEGDSEFIDRSIKTDLCARCHQDEPVQWARGGHLGVVSGTDRTSCTRCHTAEAALDDVAVAFRYPASPPNVAVPNEDGRENTATCATCHDPHGSSNEFNLRVSGDYPLPNGFIVPAGNAAQCFHCHNSRRAFDAAVAGRNDAHPGTQGDMVAGTNGAELPGFTYINSPHAIPSRFVTINDVAGEWCITCHMAPDPNSPTDPFHNQAGEHTFLVRAEDSGEAFAGACVQCHGIGKFTSARGTDAEFEFQARGDYDGDGVTESSVQFEVAGLLQLLGGSDAVSASNPFGIAVEPTRNASSTGALLLALAEEVDKEITGNSTPSANLLGLIGSHGRIYLHYSSGAAERAIPATPNGDLLFQTAWNYLMVIEDKSMGLHNTGYAVGLLQSSVLAIQERLGLTPDPDMEIYQ